MMMWVGCFQYSLGQEDTLSNSAKASLDLGADFVSSYVWRGLEIDPSPNIQGWTELYKGKFTLGIWGSANFSGTYGEVDFYATYTHNRFSLTLTDYFGSKENLFRHGAPTVHVGELTLAYSVSEYIPLNFSVNTEIYGNDKVAEYYEETADSTATYSNNYSTYLELQYPVSISKIDLNFMLGGVVNESYFYDTTSPGIVNIGLEASKTIEINNKFNLPISFALFFNPEIDGLYSVFKLSL